MSKWVGAVVGLVALLTLAVWSNPSGDRHRERIRQAVGERSPLQKVLGVGAVKAFAADYHDLVVCSYARVGDEVLSVGAFGVVVVIQ